MIVDAKDVSGVWHKARVEAVHPEFGVKVNLAGTGLDKLLSIERLRQRTPDAADAIDWEHLERDLGIGSPTEGGGEGPAVEKELAAGQKAALSSKAVLPRLAASLFYEQQQHVLIRSSRPSNQTGFKGVSARKGRFKSVCSRTPCRCNSLGVFFTPEEAARVYLKHWEQTHPEVLEKERARRPPLLYPVQPYLLIRSDRSSTGFEGVQPHASGRYKVQCCTSACRTSRGAKYLGSFSSTEEAAQVYLQHHWECHPEELVQKRKRRRSMKIRVEAMQVCGGPRFFPHAHTSASEPLTSAS
jgi:hypothetical protein